VFTLSQLALRG